MRHKRKEAQTHTQTHTPKYNNIFYRTFSKFLSVPLAPPPVSLKNHQGNCPRQKFSRTSTFDFLALFFYNYLRDKPKFISNFLKFSKLNKTFFYFFHKFLYIKEIKKDILKSINILKPQNYRILLNDPERERNY